MMTAKAKASYSRCALSAGKSSGRERNWRADTDRASSLKCRKRPRNARIKFPNVPPAATKHLIPCAKLFTAQTGLMPLSRPTCSKVCRQTAARFWPSLTVGRKRLSSLVSGEILPRYLEPESFAEGSTRTDRTFTRWVLAARPSESSEEYVSKGRGFSSNRYGTRTSEG